MIYTNRGPHCVPYNFLACPKCHADASCALTDDNADGYKCTCKQGYTGDGTTCTGMWKYCLDNLVNLFQKL